MKRLVVLGAGESGVGTALLAKEKGYKSYVLFLVQRTDCDSFNVAQDIDEEYWDGFKKAIKNSAFSKRKRL